MDSIYSNFFYLYKNDGHFKQLFAAQSMFCLPHYKDLLFFGAKNLNKKEFAGFAGELKDLETKYLDTLQEDIDWFCKKFDYRYKEEDWKNSRDAIERSVHTLTCLLYTS